jgi:hypothetical protein
MHSNDDEQSYFTSQNISSIDHESIVNEKDNVMSEDEEVEELQDILRRRLVLAGLPPDVGDIRASLDTSSNGPKMQN